MRKIALLMAGLLVMGSSFAQPKVDMAKLRAAFDFKLKDSVSARIKELSTPKKSLDGSSWEFCGLVNAKNSYGAYTGYTRFFAMTDGNWYVITAIGENAKEACELHTRIKG
ncbi:hypothetical protein ACFIQF_13090 [Comamonas sp. J-3]|uniref:hypothetical protein n=1 Tax=Comamonas trifloxystrobinivorans TaxID=3350256 RepID=UPI00372BFB94